MEGNISLRRIKVEGYKIFFFFTAVLTTLKNTAFTFLYSCTQESPIYFVLVSISFGSTHATNHDIFRRVVDILTLQLTAAGGIEFARGRTRKSSSLKQNTFKPHTARGWQYHRTENPRVWQVSLLKLAAVHVSPATQSHFSLPARVPSPQRVSKPQYVF